MIGPLLLWAKQGPLFLYGGHFYVLLERLFKARYWKHTEIAMFMTIFTALSNPMSVVSFRSRLFFAGDQVADRQQRDNQDHELHQLIHRGLVEAAQGEAFIPAAFVKLFALLAI